MQTEVWVKSAALGAAARANRRAVRVRSRRIQRRQVERISGLPYFPFCPSKHCFSQPIPAPFAIPNLSAIHKLISPEAIPSNQPQGTPDRFIEESGNGAAP